MSNRRKIAWQTGRGSKLILMGLLGIFVWVACNKKPEQIGADLQPDQDRVQLHHTDTIALNAYSLREDSVRTDEPARALLGSISDPVFGNVSAGFYTQLRLSNLAPDFGSNPQLDSLVLELRYAGFYGDTNTVQTLRIHKLNEQLYLDSVYYSTTALAFESADLAGTQFTPRPTQAFIFGEDTLSSRIRLRLNENATSLGNEILNASADVLEDNESFVAFFNGLYIAVDPVSSGGAISYIDMPSVASQLSIYYRNDERDSLRFDLFITENAPRFNRFSHDYTQAEHELREQVLQGDTSLGAEKLYLQAMGGIRTFVRFPALHAFSQNIGRNIVVNEAKLIFTGFEQEPALSPPPQLALVRAMDAKGNYSIMADQLEGENYFDGRYKASLNEYHFRITRYVQEIIKNETGTEDYGLYALVMGASARADRLVFNGTSADAAQTEFPFRLQLIYTTIE